MYVKSSAVLDMSIGATMDPRQSSELVASHQCADILPRQYYAH